LLSFFVTKGQSKKPKRIKKEATNNNNNKTTKIKALDPIDLLKEWCRE
jgi:hypothetical protein